MIYVVVLTGADDIEPIVVVTNEEGVDRAIRQVILCWLDALCLEDADLEIFPEIQGWLKEMKDFPSSDVAAVADLEHLKYCVRHLYHCYEEIYLPGVFVFKGPPTGIQAYKRHVSFFGKVPDDE